MLMEKTYLMAVDLGTSFIKAAVYDTEGKQISVSRAPVRSDSSKPGLFLQRGDEIYKSVLDAMRDAASRTEAGKICAVGFTGQMAGFMGVDRDWNDITSWSCSLDTRYVPYANEQMRTLKRQFLDICGTNAPVMSAKCSWFVSDFPAESKRVAKYMLISSYVLGRLGDLDIDDAVLGSSYITWSGLADVRERTWSEELCSASGIKRDLLPRIVDSQAVAGRLSGEAAGFLGMPSGIPLIAGAGDKIAGCVGAGVLKTGDTIFEASSYGAVSVLSDGYVINEKRHDYDAIPALDKGQFYLHKYIPGSGITLQWFADNFGTGSGGDTFKELEEQAGKIPPGSEGLMALGLLGGSAMPFDGEARGLFMGHTWSHTKAHFYRALLESFSYELAGTLDSISEMYPSFDRYGDIKIIGGGAGSDVWRRILADVTGSRFISLKDFDAALWGTAVLAGMGTGLFTDPAEKAKANVKAVSGDIPDKANREIYLRYMEIYERLAALEHPLFEELQTIEKERNGI